MPAFAHDFPFDPSCGLSRDQLLAVVPPTPPAGFAAFWRARFAAARSIDPAPELGPPIAGADGAHVVADLSYRSTGGFTIGGWLLRPAAGPITRGLVVGHGYGGRDAPDPAMAFPETAVLFPCLRGLSRSARPEISPDPDWHVLHDIQDRDAYLLGGCVDDLWLAVSALLALEPQVAGRIGFSGLSLSGGIGALALPWDDRIARGELLLPTFGHHPLRLTLPMTGSGAAVDRWQARHGSVMATLAWYDAASAARFIRCPMLFGCALFDPAVPPPGQFAVHNAVPGEKQLVTFDAGHFDYPARAAQERHRLDLARDFFSRP